MAKKIAIIDKIKGLVKKTVHIFGSKGEPAIPIDVAKKIQKDAYELSHKKSKDTFTEPYLLIAEQLSSTDDQIFRAAVYSLTNIALNKKDDAREIIAILDKQTEFEKKTKEQSEYVVSKVREIKKKYLW